MAKNKIELPAQSAYRQRLTEMLDLTYELEGLLHIGVSRSMVPPRLNHLIVNKLNAIVALADEPASADVDKEEENVVVEAQIPQSGVEAVEAEIVERQNLQEKSVESVSVSDMDTEEGFYSDDADEEPFSSTVGAEKNPAEAPKVEVALKAKEESTRREPSGGRLFSINDRFLYARELFSGRVADFDKGINVAITLDSPEEAEEYFISEWNFNPENPVAIEFLEKIKTIY